MQQRNECTRTATLGNCRTVGGSSEKFHFEALCIAAFLFAYGLLLFVVHPPISVGIDNPPYVDPAVNFVMGRGFTSTCWYAQGGGAVWAGNVPLYQFLLIPWFKIWGVRFQAVVWLNFLYVAAGSGIIWFSLKRSGLIASAPWRLGAVVFFLLSDSAYYLLTCCRHDALSFVLIALAACSLTVKHVFWRHSFLFAVATFLPWANLPNVPYTAVLGVLLLLFYPKIFWKEILWFGVGGLLGTLGLLALYHHYGVMDAFFASVAPHLHGGVPDLTAHSKGGLTQTFTLPYLALAVLGTGVVNALERRSVRFSCFVAGCLFFVPFVLLKTGVFPLYYAWYLLFLLAVLVFAQLSREPVVKRYSSVILAILMLAALVCPGSFTRRTLKSRLLQCHELPPSLTPEAFAKQVLKPNDVVWLRDFLYYEAKPLVSCVYAGGAFSDAFATHPLLEHDLDNVRVCIWKKDADENAKDIARLPGQWSHTGEEMRLQGTVYAVYRRK